MNSMDWQDFDDGLMNADERKKIEELVQSDPALEAELMGLRAFRKAVRVKGLEEPVPMRRLDAMLQDVAGRRQPKPLVWKLAPIAAVAAVGLGIAFAMPRLNSNPGFKEKIVAVNDAEQAWDIASNSMDRPMPNIQLAGLAQIGEVRCGKGYVCYEIVMDDQPYCLKMTQKPLNRSNCSKVIKENATYYESQDVAWSCAMTNLSYQVSGGTKEGRWKIALLAHREAMSGLPKPQV